VPGKQQIGGSLLHLLQASLLVAKHLQGQFGIEQRIILAVAQQLPVLVVLDEMVVGFFGKASGLRRRVSIAGLANSRRLGLAARSCGRSKAIRLWPSRKAASSASASS
jgi:hypothetical protein